MEQFTNVETILIPGIGGSKIYCKCNGRVKRLYPKKITNYVCNLNNHFFEKKCIVGVKIMKTYFSLSIYRKILEQTNVKAWPYDWRVPAIDIAKKFLIRLKELENEGKKINLIGHSNGGLIIRLIIEYLGFKNVSNVYICSSPLYGSFDPLTYFNEDLLFRRLICKKQTCPKIPQMTMNKSDLNKCIKNFRETLCYLSPTYRIFSMNAIELANALQIPRDVAIKIQAIHRILSKINSMNSMNEIDRPLYNFYFNKYKIQMMERDKNIVKELSFFAEDRTGENLKFKVCTDATVVSKDFFIPNSKIYYDKSFFPHAMNMNSQFLIDLINLLNLK